MVNGTTSSGFNYTIDERRVRSWSMIKKIARMQGTKSDIEIYGIAIELINDLLGDEQEQRLIEHVTQIYGYDDAEIVSKEFFEIIGAVRQNPELKNSSSSSDASRLMRMPSSATLQRPMEYTTTQPTPFPSSQPSQLG